MKNKRPRKLTQERAAAINRKRDVFEGTERSYEVEHVRVRAGRGQTTTTLFGETSDETT